MKCVLKIYFKDKEPIIKQFNSIQEAKKLAVYYFYKFD